MSNQLEQSSNLRIRRYIESLVDQVGEQIINTAAQWQSLPAGWSNEYQQLPVHAQRWLDPNNPRWQQENQEWHEPLSRDFGLWLKDSVDKTANSHFHLGAGEADEWRQSFKQLLRETE